MEPSRGVLDVSKKVSIERDSKQYYTNFISFANFNGLNMLKNCNPIEHKNEHHVLLKNQKKLFKKTQNLNTLYQKRKQAQWTTNMSRVHVNLAQKYSFMAISYVFDLWLKN